MTVIVLFCVVAVVFIVAPFAQPGRSYLPPQQSSSQQPSNQYGAPSQGATQPSSQYGAPNQGGSGGFGGGGFGGSQAPSSQYGAPSNQGGNGGFSRPSQSYGAPSQGKIYQLHLVSRHFLLYSHLTTM